MIADVPNSAGGSTLPDGALPDGTLLALVLTACLIAINALFVAAEFALVRVRPARLVLLAREGELRARTALYLVNNLTDALSVCQIGITLCSLILGYLGEPAFAHLLTRFFAVALQPLTPFVGSIALPVSIAASFLLVTVLLVVLGEVIPKQIAIGLSERVALATALPIRAFWFVSWPFVRGLNGLAGLLTRRMKLSSAEGGHTPEEIRQLLVLSAERGELGTMEFSLLDNLFRFARRRARDAMVPRNRVVALDVTRPPAEIALRARVEGYSRYPLVEGELDHVVGILHVKDLPTSAEPAGFDPRRLARAPLIIPDTLTLEMLLRRFQAERAHLAVVADEYGAVVGIVTLEDVLEELVGELRDEFDAEEQDAVRQRAGGGWVLDPALPLDRAVELVSEPPELPEGVHTIAGLLQSELGRIPEPGERVPFGPGHDLVAAVVQGTRILRVELIPRS